MAYYTHLEWDSSFFNFPVASVRFNHGVNADYVLSLLEAKGYHLVYFFVEQHFGMLKSSLLEKFGGRLADSKITYRQMLPEKLTINTCEDIRTNEYKQVTQELIELARLAGTYSRFNTDPKFDKNCCQNLYTEWIKKSVSGELADYVITCHFAEKPVGLITLTTRGETGKIGLLSVLGEMQGRGVGSCLLNEVYVILKPMGMKTIEVVTQEENTGACRFYENNNFKRYNKEYVYHFWLKYNDTI